MRPRLVAAMPRPHRPPGVLHLPGRAPPPDAELGAGRRGATPEAGSPRLGCIAVLAASAGLAPAGLVAILGRAVATADPGRARGAAGFARVAAAARSSTTGSGNNPASACRCSHSVSPIMRAASSAGVAASGPTTVSIV